MPAGLFEVQESVAEVKYTAVKAVPLGAAASVAVDAVALHGPAPVVTLDTRM